MPPQHGGGCGNPVCYTAMNETNSTRGVWLGLDTGGTFTDAVLLADGRVIAGAKALTTPWDLALGIGRRQAAPHP